jgi:hypothetical protein
MVYHFFLCPNKAQVGANRWYETLADMITLEIYEEWTVKREGLPTGETSKPRGE